MTRQLVIVLQVLNPFVPCEIEGSVDGNPFYYRHRGPIWEVWHHITDRTDQQSPPIVTGPADEASDNFSTAVNRILETFGDKLELFELDVEVG